MGKGDVKSRKGKITKGSYGNSRKRKDQKSTTTKPATAATATAAK